MSITHDQLTRDLNRVLAKPVDSKKADVKLAADKPAVPELDPLTADLIADYSARRNATSNPTMKAVFDQAIADLTPRTPVAPRLSEAERSKLRVLAVASKVTSNPFETSTWSLTSQMAIMKADASKASALEAQARAAGKYGAPPTDSKAPPRR